MNILLTVSVQSNYGLIFFKIKHQVINESRYLKQYFPQKSPLYCPFGQIETIRVGTKMSGFIDYLVFYFEED